MRLILAIDKEGYANEELLPMIFIGDNELEAVEKRLRYQSKKTPNGTAYWACDEKTGLVKFLFHTPDNQKGYGGSTFELRMKGGRTKKVRGPWSSRCGVMNAIGFKHCSEVNVVDDVKSGCSGIWSMLVERINPLLRGHQMTRRPNRLADDTDFAYEVTKK